MRYFAMIIGLLLAVTAVTIEASSCNIYQTTTIQIDFCDYAQVISDLVPGITSTKQIQHCIENMNTDMCAPVNECDNAGTMYTEALALLEDIINDESCTDPCTANPCGEHGVCERLSSENYICTCNPGYTGVSCGEDVDECATQNPCLNGGFCDNTHGGYLCQCTPGFAGVNCENDVNECELDSLCFNGGFCHNTIGGYICECVPGFTGPHCEEDIDECASSPCVYGVCTHGIDSFECECHPGFTGQTCSINIDDCAIQPCLNGGICIDGTNSFECECAEGFVGLTCEIDIDDCEIQPCLNGGICIDGTNSFECECAEGFVGLSCEINIDECAVQPCMNDGICVDHINGFSCLCQPGFEGDLCDIDIDECLSNPCMNDAICSDGINGFFCACQPGFQGDLCEIDIDECLSNPCMNGGICSDGINGFFCDCQGGFEGDLCEIDTFDDCAAEPCLNGGVCSDVGNTYACSCPIGYSGVNCEDDSCYMESDGWDYRGTVSTTVNGYPCQAWANVYPHRVSLLEHFLFKDHENFCRNYPGSGKDAPWCYTGLEEVEWEYCGVSEPSEFCEGREKESSAEEYDVLKAEFDSMDNYDGPECYSDEGGLDYTGYVSVTAEGFNCQRWDVNYPNKRNDAKKSKPRHNSILFGSHNYCRTDGQGPEGATTGPWCWIDDASTTKTWGYCDVGEPRESCPSKGTPVEQQRLGRYPECMVDPKGYDYEGSVHTTESGKTCLNWSSVSYTLEQAEENYCRGFESMGDRNHFARPWCFVSTTESEKCRVKDHYDYCYPALVGDNINNGENGGNGENNI